MISEFKIFGLCIAIISMCNSPNGLAIEDNNQMVRNIAESDDEHHFTTALQKILIPRIVGTQGHEEVGKFIIDDLKSMGFSVELDTFNDVAPIFGNLTFTNIIGRLNPEADQFLTLACHYDSLFLPNQQFVGAIDSAVPCAMMLNTAKTLLPSLTLNNDQNQTGLMLIFFDGEEAFKSWSENDSLYGSRHLAKKWKSTRTRIAKNANLLSEIDRIQLFVLLDLIGASEMQFFSFYRNTEFYHNKLVQIERSLKKLNLLQTSNSYMMQPRRSSNLIDDDHKPFIKLGVPILHLIATPFPRQWHTSADNYSNLNQANIKNFLKILRIFTFDYL